MSKRTDNMKRLITLLMLFALAAPALADDQVVTYIEYEGRFIELTDSWMPYGADDDTLMAVEANQITTSENYDRLDNTGLAVHPWKQVGDWVVIYFKTGEKRFASSVVITKIVNRPWINAPASPSRPDPV